MLGRYLGRLFGGVGLIACFGGGLVLLRRDSRGVTSSGGLFEAVAVAVHGQDVDMVGEPVEQRAGEPLGPQDRRPVFKGQV